MAAYTVAPQGGTGYVTIVPGPAPDALVTTTSAAVVDPILRTSAPIFVLGESRNYGANEIILAPLARWGGVQTSVPIDLGRPGVFVTPMSTLNPPAYTFKLGQPPMPNF